MFWPYIRPFYSMMYLLHKPYQLNQRDNLRNVILLGWAHDNPNLRNNVEDKARFDCPVLKPGDNIL
jgi:hypothetical protein